MRIVNNQLEDINNKEVEATMREINHLILDFINREYNDIEIEYKLDKKIEDLVVELLPSSKDKFMISYNGKKHQYLKTKTASAFVTKISQTYKDKIWFFTNGIVFPFSFSKTKIKKKIHEYFHFLSSNNKIEEIENRYYDKVGLKVTTYDDSDNVIDETFSCGFLNEGMTEYLASQVTNTYPDAYEFNVMVIEILTMNNHYELIDAYFSDNFQKLLDYKHTFEKITNNGFDIIFNNDQYGINITKNKIEEIIITCLSFQINIALSELELDKIETNIMSILQKYRKSLDFSFDIKKITNTIIEMINFKKQNLSRKNK